MEDRYPLPETVGAYGGRDELARSRIESGQWVFWEDRTALILDGRYDEVVPLHIELSPTYLCNFACPWCSCRSAREDWCGEDVFSHPDASEATVMGRAKLERILDHLAGARVGIQWVGGEPTMNPLLYPMAAAAAERGLAQCLFTNGSLLHPNRIDALLAAGLAFIRVSLDAVTEQVHREHHGYDERRPYHARVIHNLRELARRRLERGAATQVAVSIVVDERNLGDLVPTAHFLRDLCTELGRGAIDYVIIRPTYQFYSAQLLLRANTKRRLAALVAAGAEARDVLEAAGVRVIAPSASFEDPRWQPPEAGEACLSAGWFGEVTPAGDLVACSDRYGNPEYFIGNLAEQSLEEIWSRPRRREVLEMADRTRCFRNSCPRNGRGFQLNRVFHQIERFRRAGRVDEVRRWVEDLRRTLPRPSHSFFL